MKKGMVIKIKNKYALVLAEDSLVEKITLKPDMHIGQHIYYFEGDVYKMKSKSLLKVSALVASLLIIFFIATIVNPGNVNVANAQPYAAVTIDINPSVELILDEDEKVIEVNALNDDAESIISEDLIGMNLDDALEWIVSKAEEEGYLVDDGTILISSVILEIPDEDESTDDDDEDGDNEDNEDNEDDEDIDEDEETDKVEETIQSFIERKTEQYEFLYAKGTEDAYKASKSQGLSLGKYQMLKFLDDSITQEEIKVMKVTEIAERKQERTIEKAANKEKNGLENDEKIVIDDIDNSDDNSEEDDNEESAVTNNKEKSQGNDKKSQVTDPKSTQTKEKTNNSSKEKSDGNIKSEETIKPTETPLPTNLPVETISPTETPKVKDEKEKDKETNKEFKKEINNNSNNKSKGNN